MGWIMDYGVFSFSVSLTYITVCESSMVEMCIQKSILGHKISELLLPKYAKSTKSLIDVSLSEWLIVFQ
jgi:hypothetical protein